MTLAKFLERLAELTDSGHRTWEIDRGAITSVEDDLCPIHEVWLASDEGHAEGHLIDWSEEAGRLGLRAGVAMQIVLAADGNGMPKTRAKLLAACGLALTGRAAE